MVMGEKGIEDTEYSCSIKFTWKIPNFSTLETEKIYSDTFTGGDYKWKILIYPKGRHKDNNLSIFMCVADSETLPHGWTRDVNCSLSVINDVDEHTVKREFQHTFSASDNYSSWGFRSFIALTKLRQVNPPFLIGDTCTIRAKVLFNEEKDKVHLKSVQNSSSFSEFDSLFKDIQNRLKEKTTNNTFTDNEIGDAQIIFKRCLNMDLTSFIRSGKAPELKNAFSLLLTANALPDSVIDETSKFVANLDQLCKKYEAAKRDLNEAQEAEDSVDELQATLNRLSSKFMPVRNQAEAVDTDVERLAGQLYERKAKRARLGKRLDELAEQATTSKQALLRAEEHMKLTKIKKGEADKVLSEFEISWESLKDLHSVKN